MNEPREPCWMILRVMQDGSVQRVSITELMTDPNWDPNRNPEDPFTPWLRRHKEAHLHLLSGVIKGIHAHGKQRELRGLLNRYLRNQHLFADFTRNAISLEEANQLIAAVRENAEVQPRIA